MAVLFFDTSALAKRYHQEQGTGTVDDLIEDDRRVVISSLAIVEITSAFRRKYNRDELENGEMRTLLAACFREALEDFSILPLDQSIRAFSFDLILEDNLRTLDSLQLAAGLSIQSDEEDVVFVSADTDLNAVATSWNLEVVDPTA